MKLFLTFFCFFLIKWVYPQGNHPVSDSAEMYLTGILVPYSPVKAHQLFISRAQNGEAKAMNAVGIMYHKGMGVDSSFFEAAFWFRQAAISGYTKAWVNLGMLYKRYNYDSTGYAKANLYFDTALIYREPSAYFAKGYMLYKGLGGSQDYTSALYFFRLGNGLNRADCMYFTGLCFKYGYGLNVNVDSATFYIDRAARFGYRPANAERYFNLTKDSTVFVSKASGINKEVAINPISVQSPKPFKSISYSPRYIQQSGNYAGTIIQYDYSGKNILAEVPVELNVTATGTGMKGIWYQGNQEPVLLEAHQSGNHFTFTSASFLNATLKGKKKRLPLIFRSLRVEIHTRGDSVYLTGTVQLYNTYTREPEKPLNVRFAKSVSGDADTSTFAVAITDTAQVRAFLNNNPRDSTVNTGGTNNWKGKKNKLGTLLGQYHRAYNLFKEAGYPEKDLENYANVYMAHQLNMGITVYKKVDGVFKALNFKEETNSEGEINYRITICD